MSRYLCRPQSLWAFGGDPEGRQGLRSGPRDSLSTSTGPEVLAEGLEVWHEPRERD